MKSLRPYVPRREVLRVKSSRRRSRYRSKRMWENDEWADKLDYNSIIENVNADGLCPTVYTT